ncbi:hypothetical protein PVL29_001462 [Vitis rotundifolia]|uniref:Light-regulated protein n=1 Tax=Vitis rotundifolia TaxID=103349 RepID=A0AA39ALR6_VITRO|nr:hypothetical protein PVL29_001462 [Vitis rotundifolia]
MQAALCFPPSTLPLLTPTKPFSSPKNPISKLQTSLFRPLRATSKLQETPSTVDYSSTTSVFPAEACEVVGGEACDAEMYPEVKLKAEDGNPPARSATEGVDREYLEYNSPKTVFPGEACDDLGGEFCEPEYQEGVFQEK